MFQNFLLWSDFTRILYKTCKGTLMRVANHIDVPDFSSFFSEIFMKVSHKIMYRNIVRIRDLIDVQNFPVFN